jgi:3-oxoacyl-[acyl-carrier-protein] synthase III
MAAPTPLPARIRGTAHVAPGPAVTTAELAARMNPPRDAADLERRTGIASRHFAEPSPTCSSDLGAEVLRRALDDAGMHAEELERVIFVSSTGGDVVTPANATRVIARLGLVDTCDGFDVANGCVGFLSALDVAARCLATGMGPIAIVDVELLHRVIAPDDPRPYMIFGDAAVAVVLDRGRPGEGMLASYLRNDGVAGGDVHLQHPLATREIAGVYFTTSGARMGEDAVEYMSSAMRVVLDRAALRREQVEWILPHQPNGRMLEILVDGLGLDRSRLVSTVHDNGSVSAASLPISLHRLLKSGRVRAGEHVMLVGVGTGLAYGAVLWRVGG